jgi:hypothetical protein
MAWVTLDESGAFLPLAHVALVGLKHCGLELVSIPMWARSLFQPDVAGRDGEDRSASSHMVAPTAS